MQIGIVGPKYSGKTTVFNALTGAKAASEALSGAAIKLNLGVIKVPDERVNKLSLIFNPKKTVYTDIQFVDIPVPAEAKEAGKGLDAQTVSHIRNTDALVIVVRDFENPSVPHPSDKIDPMQDFINYEGELRITDFVQVENRLDRMKKENKKGMEFDILTRFKEQLENDKPLRLLKISEAEQKAVVGFRFLSQKPLLVLVNTSESSAKDYSKLSSESEKTGGKFLPLSAQVEHEISQLPQEEQADFLKEMGIERPARERFIRSAYDMMNFISFFTVGEDEVRAWTVTAGAKAPQAAGKIHSDLERGFIRADIVGYADFEKAGSLSKARENATLRQEGKEYIVKDGDIMEVKFNV
jgi:hypothetical protein